MEENYQDNSEVLENTENTEAEAVETTDTEELSREEIDALRAKAAKVDELEEKNKKLYARAKKAEEKPAEAPLQDGQFAPKDFLALTQSGVTADDFDEVVRVAKILGKPISEALQDKTLKSILQERVEERKSASVAHTRGGARGASKVNPEDVLIKAEKGEVLESADDMQKIYQARVARRVGSMKN